MKLVKVGKTSYGKPWTAAIISSPANLARLDQLKQINQRIAHPEGLTDAAAQRLARDGRAFVDISGGLHASEIAGSQHTPQLAYELLRSANEPEMKAILDNVVFFLWPSINPDGQDIVVNWCRARDAAPGQPMRADGALPEVHRPRQQSRLVHAQHDRIARRAAHVARVGAADHLRAAPVVAVPDAHLASAVRRSGRIARAADHGADGEHDRHAHRAGARSERTCPAPCSQLDTYDAWYPGYIDYMPMYQNINAWWTETQGGNCATPRTTTVDRSSARLQASCVRRRSTPARGPRANGGFATR